MLCRRMIDYNVHHYFQPSFMCFMKKIFEIICCSVNRVYIIVICNIISVIITRTYIYRCQPYIFYPQLCNIRKPADYSVNISYSITITVLKAFWINLIYTHLFIICHLFLLYTKYNLPQSKNTIPDLLFLLYHNLFKQVCQFFFRNKIILQYNYFLCIKILIIS